MNIFSKGINFIKDVKSELGKVSWSTREEITGATFVVIAITFLTGLFIGLIDLLLSKILSVVFR
ncbi:MAG: preprotein translocase subunit SecE [Candidatus Omnitrophica bacterium]|nr:preprotein translocase subunit SecE [Candidatus Omnitrophota bacterium]